MIHQNILSFHNYLLYYYPKTVCLIRNQYVRLLFYENYSHFMGIPQFAFSYVTLHSYDVFRKKLYDVQSHGLMKDNINLELRVRRTYAFIASIVMTHYLLLGCTSSWLTKVVRLIRLIPETKKL